VASIQTFFRSLKPRLSVYLCSIAFSFWSVARLSACDICSCAVPNHPWDPRAGFILGAAEQYTRFDTIQVDGDEIGNPAGQFLNSSITQLYLGYNFFPSLGVRANVPLIYRSYRRTTDTGIQNGKVSGLGDISLLAHYIPIVRETKDFSFQARIDAGIKLPTGDSDILGEEAEAGHSHGTKHNEHEEGNGHEHEHEEAHGDIPANAIHGHDLALGSGSIDGAVGGSFYARYRRVFLAGEIQYASRGDGSFDYRYANDLSFSTGPGVYVIDTPDVTLALRAIFSGETKGKDHFRGNAVDDTAATFLYLGPKIAFTWRDHLSAEVELDLPVSRDNSSLQIVPDYRVRAGLSWAF
jgi:hypothetical protein